jgi:hypothetical protein
MMHTADSVHPLLREIEAFLEDTGMTPTAFGLQVMGDKGFVHRLREGRDFRNSTEQRIRLKMATYRQHGVFESPHREPKSTQSRGSAPAARR